MPDIYSMCGRGATSTWETKPSGVTTFNGTNVGTWPVNPSKRGFQYTESESHAWNRRSSKPNASGDVGGPFFTTKVQIVPDRPESVRLTGVKLPLNFGDSTFTAVYNGPVLGVDPGLIVVPTSIHRSKSALETLGTTAIARVKPTNRMAEVATALGEIVTGGLPRLAGSSFWKEKVESGRKIGDEYLNQEFGWKPLVGDITDIARGVAFARLALQQLEQNSRQAVRRRYNFPEETTQSLAQIAFSNVDPATPIGVGVCRDVGLFSSDIYKDVKTYRKVWFSGAFTFHLPSGWKSRNALVRLGAKADALLGTGLDPETLWNLAPWSWAADWFSNAGDVISNLSDWATDGLVLKYGYVMEHSFVTHRYYKTDNRRLHASNSRIFPSPVTVSVETKQRVMATPYGFGLNWSSFTPRQLSIAAALGLTRK